jgi:hypothetical protein
LSLYNEPLRAPSQKSSIHRAGLSDKAIIPASHLKCTSSSLVFSGGTERGRGVTLSWLSNGYTHLKLHMKIAKKGYSFAQGCIEIVT